MRKGLDDLDDLEKVDLGASDDKVAWMSHTLQHQASLCNARLFAVRRPVKSTLEWKLL